MRKLQGLLLNELGPAVTAAGAPDWRTNVTCVTSTDSANVETVC